MHGNDGMAIEISCVLALAVERPNQKQKELNKFYLGLALSSNFSFILSTLVSAMLQFSEWLKPCILARPTPPMDVLLLVLLIIGLLVLAHL
ncbi:hypothetical protein V6N13_052181 [Hibiscus sabdariffa]|uniref:Uncharacterized protein n=1 Tax=Hibiscus sabdariffa TaxID=183260 RepID=A0ABR2BI22_9ROSI